MGLCLPSERISLFMLKVVVIWHLCNMYCYLAIRNIGYAKIAKISHSTCMRI